MHGLGNLEDFIHALSGEFASVPILTANFVHCSMLKYHYHPGKTLSYAICILGSHIFCINTRLDA